MSHDDGWLSEESVNLMVHICNYYACDKCKEGELPQFVALPSTVLEIGLQTSRPEGNPSILEGGSTQYTHFDIMCYLWYSEIPKVSTI